MIINGWTLYFHPLFVDRLARLIADIESERSKNPSAHRTSPKAKLLKSIRTIVLNRIPNDPTDKRYRLGGTLGSDRKHWFRDKFGNGRFRLFFRFDTKAKIILYGWLNDETTLRTYGSKSDAYAVFTSMLNDGNPPDSWDKLLAACSGPEVVAKAAEFLTRTAD